MRQTDFARRWRAAAAHEAGSQLAQLGLTGFGIGSGLAASATQHLRYKPFFESREAFYVKKRNDKNPYPKGKVTLYTGLDNLLFEAKIDLTKFLQ